MRGDAKSDALREVVADLLSTGAGATYAVKQISGVTQRVDLPGGHPLVGRYVPDLWLTDGSRLTDHGHNGGFPLRDRTPDATLTHLAAPWSDRVTNVRDDEAAPAGVLVRPDGVIAWASDTGAPAAVSDLETALHRWAGAPSTAA